MYISMDGFVNKYECTVSILINIYVQTYGIDMLIPMDTV